MIRALALGLLLALGATEAEATCALPFTFVNGTLADATQVNANFSALVACSVSGPATSQAGDIATWSNTTGNSLNDLGTPTQLVFLTAAPVNGLLNIVFNHPASANPQIFTGEIISADSLANNASVSGAYGMFMSIRDTPGVVTGTKGKISGLQISMTSLIARNNSPFDDATPLAIQNPGTAPITAFITLNTVGSASPYEATTGIEMNASNFYGQQFNGSYSYGIDFLQSTVSVGAIRLAGGQALIVGTPNIQVVGTDSGGNTYFSQNGLFASFQGDIRVNHAASWVATTNCGSLVTSTKCLLVVDPNGNPMYLPAYGTF